jgi:hypothetical protein
MIKSDALSCPICEGKPLSNKHRCQDYYDNILNNAQVTYSSNGVTSAFISPTAGKSSFGDTASITIPENVLALKEEIKLLKHELHQQRFNNEKNISIDGVIADKIKELQTQNIALIDYLELMMLHKDTEIFEAEVKEYIKRIE